MAVAVTGPSTVLALGFAEGKSGSDELYRLTIEVAIPHLSPVEVWSADTQTGTFTKRQLGAPQNATAIVCLQYCTSECITPTTGWLHFISPRSLVVKVRSKIFDRAAKRDVRAGIH